MASQVLLVSTVHTPDLKGVEGCILYIHIALYLNFALMFNVHCLLQALWQLDIVFHFCVKGSIIF
jgi:hypothetical protein